MNRVDKLLNKQELEKDKLADKICQEIYERFDELKALDRLDRFVMPQLTEDIVVVEETKEEEIVVEVPEVKEEKPVKKTNSKMAMLKKIKPVEEFSMSAAAKEIEAETKEEVPCVRSNRNKCHIDKYDRYDTKEAIAKRIPEYADIIIGTNGDITINDKSYKFKARREFYMPIIYGCFNEEIVKQAREEINKIDRFRLSEERTTNDVNFKYAKDKEYPIVVWRCNERGNTFYRAYTRTKGNRIVIVLWEKGRISKTTVESYFSNKPAWRKLDSKPLADKFMAVCADIWPEDFTNDNNDSQITKEQHQPTNEVPQDTNEIVVDFTNDPTAGCDDLDI